MRLRRRSAARSRSILVKSRSRCRRSAPPPEGRHRARVALSASFRRPADTPCEGWADCLLLTWCESVEASWPQTPAALGHLAEGGPCRRRGRGRPLASSSPPPMAAPCIAGTPPSCTCSKARCRPRECQHRPEGVACFVLGAVEAGAECSTAVKDGRAQLLRARAGKGSDSASSASSMAFRVCHARSSHSTCRWGMRASTACIARQNKHIFMWNIIFNASKGVKCPRLPST